MGARAMNLSMGMWLFLSGFLWRHGRPQTINAWVVGILVVSVALAGLEERPHARWINVSLGVWLIVSTFFLPGTTHVTAVNHVVVGMIITSLASLRRIGQAPRPQTP
jgi:hypothetical protein